jgi:SAM-dependent methyltransferase
MPGDGRTAADARIPDTEPPGHRGFNAALRGRCGGTVLDAACGKGRWAEWAVKHGKGYCGVDIDESPVARCQAQFPNFRFLVGDCRSLPFEARSFDTVLLVEVLEHLRAPGDAPLALREACRVARGCVALTTPDCTDAERLSAAGLTFAHMLEGGKGRKFRNPIDAAHAHWFFYTRDSLSGTLSALGHPFELHRARRVECLDFPCYAKLEAFIDLTGRIGA